MMLLLLSGTAGLLCCAPQKPAESPVSESHSITLAVPEVTPVQAGSETQDNKGVTVSVVPASFKVVETPKQTCAAKPNSDGSLLGGLVKVDNNSSAKKSYVVATENDYTVAPKTIAFKVSVTNHTTHVLRLGGSVLKLNVSGRQVQLSSEGTKAFLDGVLTPNENQSFDILGPEIDPTFQQATLDFQLFDVPVEIDKAGNVVEKANFAWTFKAKLENKTIQSEKKTETVSLDAAEARSKGCAIAGGTAGAA